jgi:hypothetical protein
MKINIKEVNKILPIYLFFKIQNQKLKLIMLHE